MWLTSPLPHHSCGENSKERNKNGSANSISLINVLLEWRFSSHLSPQISSAVVFLRAVVRASSLSLFLLSHFCGVVCAWLTSLFQGRSCFFPIHPSPSVTQCLPWKGDFLTSNPFIPHLDKQKWSVTWPLTGSLLPLTRWRAPHKNHVQGRARDSAMEDEVCGSDKIWVSCSDSSREVGMGTLSPICARLPRLWLAALGRQTGHAI